MKSRRLVSSAGEWACKPDSVEDDHLSGTGIAPGLMRAYPSDDRAGLDRSYSPLLRVGFAKPPCHHDAGALLPHRFSFSAAEATESSFLWHFPSGRPALPLAGTLPCGVRTFLTNLEDPRDHPAHSASILAGRNERGDV